MLKTVLLAIAGIGIGFAATAFEFGFFERSVGSSTPPAEPAVAAIASPPPIEPYSFRGIALGITLAEFKRIPFPDIRDKPGTKAFCSNEDPPHGDTYAHNEVLLDPDLKQIGAISCEYFAPTQCRLDHSGQTCFLLSAPQFAGVGDYLMRFLFTPRQPGQDPLLFAINTNPQSDRFDKVISTMMARYGPPTSTTAEPATFMSGATLPNAVHVWNNSVSTITVRHFAEKMTQMSVSYNHSALTAEIAGALARAVQHTGRQQL